MRLKDIEKQEKRLEDLNYIKQNCTGHCEVCCFSTRHCDHHCGRVYYSCKYFLTQAHFTHDK